MDEEGVLPHRQLNQIVAFNMEFDQDIYSHGDTLWVTADIINRSGAELVLGLSDIFYHTQPFYVFSIISAKTDSLVYYNFWPGDTAPWETHLTAGDTLPTRTRLLVCTHTDSLPPCSHVYYTYFLEPGRYYWVPDIREMTLDDNGFYRWYEEVASKDMLFYQFLYQHYTHLIGSIFSAEDLDAFMTKAGLPSFEVQ